MIFEAVHVGIGDTGTEVLSSASEDKEEWALLAATLSLFIISFVMLFVMFFGLCRARYS